MDDGTPLYCADPSTTIASERGCESCRAVHQIAVAVETTSRTTESAKAPTTRPTRLPARTPTRHGYHAGPSVRGRRDGCAALPTGPLPSLRGAPVRDPACTAPSAARPASSRATGTRNGEQDT